MLENLLILQNQFLFSDQNQLKLRVNLINKILKFILITKEKIIKIQVYK